MPHPDEEAELEQSKMSFSEHLNELRRAVVKSLLVLTVGFLVGLAFGWNIVDYIQGPLREALETHYQRRAEAEQLRRYEEAKAIGERSPDDPAAAAAEMAREGLAPRVYYLDPQSLVESLKTVAPDLSQALAERFAQNAQSPTAVRREDMVKLRVFQPIEEDPRMRVVGLTAQEPFMVYVKASLVAGFVLASPLVFLFIWEFVAAGLYRHERKYIYTYLPISLGLFLAGAAVAFYVAFDYVLDFLFWFYEKMGVDPDPRLSEWISFVLILPLGFGISFQLPLVMLLLERIGVISVDLYVSKWRIAILVICTLSMFLTPADPGSMIVMAVPLIVLYFGGILMCLYMPGRRRVAQADNPASPPAGSESSAPAAKPSAAPPGGTPGSSGAARPAPPPTAPASGSQPRQTPAPAPPAPPDPPDPPAGGEDAPPPSAS